jgi:photosystem II stability/assembly factor-like uncharacterized protein
MATRCDSLLIVLSVIVIALCLFGAKSSAQQEPSVDPWNFPELTTRKFFLRAWREFEQRAYPLGDIPAGAKLGAFRQIEQFKARRSPIVSQAVPGNVWINIGPAPITPIFGGIFLDTGQTPRPKSGRVADVAVHPSDPNHWLIGAAQGGVWRTLDSGATWTPLTDTQASLAMGAIAFAPSNPNIIYAGTGEDVSYAGLGLLKSTDGGASWTLLAPSSFAKASFSDIKVHFTDPNILLAATKWGVAGRGGFFPPSVPRLGVHKSTDGGLTWAQKLNGEGTDLEVDPSNFSRVYAAVGAPFGSPLNGIFRSTDAGETWSLIVGPWSTLPGGIGRVEMAIAPSNPNTLYVSIQDAIDTVGTDNGLLGLFRTDNAWDATPTWVQIPTGAIDDGSGVHGYCGWRVESHAAAHQCSWNHEIIVDPNDPNTLYAGGIALWKCTNCSASPTWMEISHTVTTPLNSIHVDQHALAWAGSRLVVGNDGGVWSTPDGGNTWANHNTNLSITQFYDGSIHPTNPNFVIAGGQDNGTEQWIGTNDWRQLLGGDGAASAISSLDPDNKWALSYQFLDLRRTLNGGVSYSAANSGIDKTGAPFIARLEKCPSNDDVFIAGTDNLWRSSNFFSGGSPSWSSNGPEMASGISALGFAPSDSTCSTYAFGTADGQLRLTTDGGGTWKDVEPTNGAPNRYVTDLAFDPTNANILYITLSGFDEGTPGQPGHVFKSTNALAPSPTWSNVTPPVNIPHNAIVVDPSDPTIVYVGTDLGIWKSTSGGGAWTHMGPEVGMPNVAVFDLKINPATNRLVAFTHGRGAFALTTATYPINIVSPDSLDFGTVTIGGSADKTFSVQNVGGGTLSGSASTTAPFSIVSGGSYNLTEGQSQNVTVRFSPTSSVQSFGNVSFTGGAGAAKPVSGTGAASSLTLGSLTLPTAEVGVFFDAPLITGGIAPFSFTFPKGGAFPLGLSFDTTTGWLTGTPTSSKAKAFTVRITDAFKAQVTGTFTPKFVAAVTISNKSLKAGTHGVAYSATLAAKGGQGPFNWTETSGNLTGVGLALNPLTGAITGTPVSAGGPFTFTFHLTDKLGGVADKPITLVVK